MNIKLEIGPEILNEETLMSGHVLNLKKVDKGKKDKAHEEVSINLKEEIKARHSSSGRICIVGETPIHKQGLGRIPMIAAAVLTIMLLNMGQVIFLGKSKGKDALASAAQAFGSLKVATESVVGGEAGAENILFGEAENLFADAQEKSKFLLLHHSEWLSEPQEVKSLRALLDAGKLIAEVGQNISDAKTKISNIPETGSLTEFLKEISATNLEPSAENLLEINALLAQVDLGNTDYETKFLEVKEKIKALSAMFQVWVSNKDALLSMLGDRYPQRYLVLLMNNDEMRPGGGFIGSYVILDINDGRIQNYEFNDVYNLDGGYFDQIEMPIHELKSLTNYWRLRDSNISADFPYSAKQAAWFLEHEGGPGVDGVIGLNLSSAQAFMEETGEIEIPSLTKPITSESLPTILSVMVESKTYGAATPKQVLSELVSAFMEKMKNQEIAGKIFSRALLEASKKQILAYHKYPEVQSLISNFDFDGALPDMTQINGDYLLTVFTNIGANKTDRYTNTKITSDTEILSDGGVVGTLSISRKHTFTEQTLSWIKNIGADYGFYKWTSGLEKILGNDINKAGIRIYLPEGSQILESSGLMRDDIQFYYDTVLKVTYFYAELDTAPGQTSNLTISYSLPWKFSGDFKEYNFKLLKQPGMKNLVFEKTFTAGDKTLLSSYPLPSSTLESTDYYFKNNLENDLDFKVLYH